MQYSIIWISALIVMNFVWAGAYAVAKSGLESIGALDLVFWRFAATFVIFLSWFLFTRPSLKMGRSDALRIVITGSLLGGSHLLWVAGINMSFATDASLLFVFEPVLGILLASLILRERLLLTTVLGLLLVLGGLAALSNFELKAFGFERGAGFGNLLIVLGLVCEAFFSVILKPVVVKLEPAVVIFGTTAVAMILISISIGFRGTLPVLPSVSALWAIGYLAILCTVAGYTLWVSVMRHVPVGVMLFTVFIQPVAGPFIAAVFLHETIDSRIVKGGAFLLLGMFVAVGGHLRLLRRKRLTAKDEAIPVAGNI